MKLELMPEICDDSNSFQVRYVPDPRVKNEFVNIGVCGARGRRERPRRWRDLVRFTRDWQRVRCLDPDADINRCLERLEVGLRQRLASSDERAKPFLEVQMLDSWSNDLTQISDAKGCLAENLATAMDTLMKYFVAAAKARADAGLAQEPSRS